MKRRIDTINNAFFILLLLMCVLSTSTANVISLNKFTSHNLVYTNQIWNKYIHQSCAEFLNRAMISKPTSLLGFKHHHFQVSLRNHQKTVQKRDACQKSEYLYRSTMRIVVMGRVCDDFMAQEEYKGGRKEPIYPPVPHSLQRLCSRSVHYVMKKASEFHVRLHENLMLNLTVLRIDIELTYRCLIENIAKGMTRSLAARDRICGKLPQMTYFLHHPQIFLIVDVLFDKKPGRVDLQFQVSDPHYVSPIPCERSEWNERVQYKCYHIGYLSTFTDASREKPLEILFLLGFTLKPYEIGHHVYSIHTRKFFQLRLTNTRHMDNVSRLYDGPYIMRKLLVHADKSSAYQFSSFQATHVFRMQNRSQKTSQHNLEIGTVISRCTCPISNDQKLFFLSEEKYMSLRNCTGDCSCERGKVTYCVIIIWTKSNHYVKVSFNIIQYEGPNIDNCRFGGVTVFDGDRYITNLCGSYSQNIKNQTSSKVPMDIVSTGSNLTLVIYSYLDDIKVNFTYCRESCPGIFLNPCSGVVWARTRTIDTGRFILKREDHWVRNMYVLHNCGNARGMKIHFKTFSLRPEYPCATIQIHTPQWQYPTSRGKFHHHCQLILFQDHSQNEYRLHYNIKSFQHSNIVVMAHDIAFDTVNLLHPCNSLHNRVVYRELPSCGDMIAYNFIEGKIQTEHHSIINQRCPKRNDHIKTLQVQECNVQILSKSYNSSLISYYTVTEIPRKLRYPVSVPGTVSTRLRTWGASWTSLKVRLVCHVPNTKVAFDGICNYAKLSPCRKVARYAETHFERNSILKLSLNPSKTNDNSCYLGKLKVKLKFREFCIETEQDNTAISVTTDLTSSMFHNDNYYLHVPMDYEPYYPVLSYNAQTQHTKNTVTDICQNMDIYFRWHAIKIPRSKLRHRDIEICLLYDYGDSMMLHKQLRVLEPKWQEEADASFLKSQHNSTIISEKTYYTLWSYKVNVTKLNGFTWKDAHFFCRQRDSHLVTIHSISDLKHLLQFLFEFIYEERVPIYAIYIGVQLNEWHNILKHADNSSLAYQLWLNQQYGAVKRHHRISEIIRLSETNSHFKKLLKLPSVTHISIVEMMLENITDSLQPELNHKKKCSLLLFNDMLQPETLMIDCETTYVKNRVVCRKYKNRNVLTSKNDLYCSPDTLHVSDKCYKAYYKTKKASLDCIGSVLWDLDLYPSLKSILETMTILQGRNATYVSMTGKKGNREICNSLTNSFTPLYLFESLPWTKVFDQLCHELTGMYFCTGFAKQFIDISVDSSNIFLCNNGIYISSIFLCDTINHCRDSSDEIFCTTLKTSNTNLNDITKKCMVKHKAGSVPLDCLMWYDESGTYRTYLKAARSVKTASNFSDQLISNSYNSYTYLKDDKHDDTVVKTDYFRCKDGLKISLDLVNDTMPDCINGEDELEYKSLLISHNKKSNRACEDPTMLPCIPGHSRCFNISNICLYRRHPVNDHLEYCRNGAHLAECETFHCDDNFKCPGYYCLHIGHLCDGVRDCPNGEDEIKCAEYNCVGKYKCKNAQKCIHIREMCDGILHCIHEDDEKACDIKTCWPNCFCLNYAVHCDQLEITYLLKQNNCPYVYVSMQSTSLNDTLFELKEFFSKFNQALFLYLKNNGISSVCPNYFHSKSLLIKVSITNNKLRELQKGCFSKLEHLNELSLNRNLLDQIEPDSFLNLSRLVSLDLSSNKLTILNSNSFNHLVKLSFLNLLNNPLEVLDLILFEKLFPSLKQIQTEDYRICCLAKRPIVTCNAYIPWPSSCSNILESNSLRHLMLGIAIGVFCLNSISIFNHTTSMLRWKKLKLNSRIKAQKHKIGYNCIVIFINTSDIILSIYLMILVRMDNEYEGYFSIFEQAWRKSKTCHFLSFAYLLTSLLSVYSVTLLALKRNRIITNPMNTTFSKKTSIFRMTAAGVILAVLISLATMTSYRFLEGNISQSNALCLLIGNLGNSITIKVATGMFAFIEFCGIVLNITLYAHLLNFLFQQKQELAKVTGNGARSVKISTVTQLLIVGVSNILCWAPGGILNILSLAVEGYSIEALLWITTVATPLNGIVNPIVFNYSLAIKIWKKAQKRFSR